MRLLFVKHSLAWPRSSGHDVHTFHMMKACGELGHEVSLATVVPPEPPAIEGATIREYVRLTAPLDMDADADPLPGTRLQHKFRSFWGVEDHWVRSLRAAARRLKPDAVIVGGLDALPYFPALENTIRVWYAADEWVLHHLSMLQFRRGHFVDNLKGAAMKGLYERAHRDVMERVWVVTERDRRAMQRVAGVRDVDVLPNGVDADFFKPGPEPVEPKTAVFWGRLDFGPNIQALEWFCRRVWPKVRATAPDARFTIIGFQPTPAVKALATAPGITLRGQRARPPAGHAETLPLRCCRSCPARASRTSCWKRRPWACRSSARRWRRSACAVRRRSSRPRMPVNSPSALIKAWSDTDGRAARSRAMREWVMREHSWRATAEAAGDRSGRHRSSARSTLMADPIRVGFVLHVMQVAGAEVLVDETIRRLGSRISPVVFCLDKVGPLGERLQADGVPVIAYGPKAGAGLFGFPADGGGHPDAPDPGHPRASVHAVLLQRDRGAGSPASVRA